MATELYFPGMGPAWRSQCADGYQVIADLDEVSIWYRGHDFGKVERAYYRAAVRTLLRRYMPFLATPPAERVFE